MAYGKEDFINFNDLDLDELLGEFTASEVEASDDDFVDELKPTNSSGTTKKKLYECDSCDKTYNSISGIRGHMRTKHGVQNVKASKYRAGLKDPDRKAPFRLDKTEFHDIFCQILPTAITNVIHNKFRKLPSSVHGRGIITIASKLTENLNVKQKFMNILEPIYLEIMSTAAETDSNVNEALFAKFYELIFDDTLIESLAEALSSIVDVNAKPSLPVRQFISVLNRLLMEDFIQNRAIVYSKEIKAESGALSDTDQSVLFYISGFILRKLEKKLEQKSDLAVTEAHMKKLLKRKTDSEKNFISNFAEWTEQINRGGLKTPSDNFFLFIRSCEMCIRNNINEKQVDANTYVAAKEVIMEDHMTKFYSEKLFDRKDACFMFEQCVALFIRVRGFAAARLKRREYSQDTESSKALRKVLKDKTNK